MSSFAAGKRDTRRTKTKNKKMLLENEFFPLTGERLRQMWKSKCVCVSVCVVYRLDIFYSRSSSGNSPRAD